MVAGFRVVGNLIGRPLIGVVPFERTAKGALRAVCTAMIYLCTYIHTRESIYAGCTM